MTIFITGAAGYIGGMLAHRFLGEKQVKRVVCLDIKPAPPHFPVSNPKVAWVIHDLGEAGWEEKVLKWGAPDVVIHCAYLIRVAYSSKHRERQIKSNIGGAEKVFQFALNHGVKKLIHFSTAASYGAYPTNTTKKRFKEDDPFRDSQYLYAQDKKIIEEKIEELFKALKPKTQVFVIRPAAVTGPRGQFMYNRFGLLQMVKQGLPIVPITHPDSARQFIHEDDIFEAISLMTFGNFPEKYHVFNLAPQDFLLLTEVARTIKKPIIRIPKILGKFAFATLWHLSRGKIPTAPAGIDSYSYPIILDGSKITKFGFQYSYNSLESLRADRGYYARFVEHSK
ncbi:NAD-dependent epimerase/dehydratase family protein [Candidatus Daviesbacteria bacterium]|nr:NAD-dependent epimerase/dehydratase family protein [Candidatus Daviesbacteria bacterium]